MFDTRPFEQLNKPKQRDHRKVTKADLFRELLAEKDAEILLLRRVLEQITRHAEQTNDTALLNLVSATLETYKKE